MYKFNIGDEVELLVDICDLRKGSKGVIISTGTHYDYYGYRVCFDPGNNICPVYRNEITLVEHDFTPPKPDTGVYA